MISSRLFPILGIPAAIGLGLLATVNYWLEGQGLQVVAPWVGALLLGWRAFRNLETHRSGEAPAYDRSDGRLVMLLVLLFAPLYVAYVYYVPHQINTDELAIMRASSEITAWSSWDFFSLSHYSKFPSFIFLVYGTLGRLTGGINLANMRAIHASFGVVIVALSYLLFRRMLSRQMALAASIVLGANHALLAISRMAMRDNSGLLVEIMALLLLFAGYQSNRLGLSFIGGAIAGLTVYVYEPSRMTVVIWVVFLAIAAAVRANRDVLRRTIQVAIPAAVGFLLIASPLAVATFKESLNPNAFSYQRQQLLFTPEGRELQRYWVDAETVIEGIRINAKQGILAYNARLHDQGYIYFHPGHGFVDPLTGILLWIGAAAIVSSLRQRKTGDLLMLAGFLLYWLTFTFVTTKAPNYTRMLTTLPFVAYLVVRGAEWVGQQLRRLFELRKNIPSYSIGALAIWALVGAIVIWNLAIFGDFVVKGFVQGDEVGGVVRYVEARSADKEHSFFVLASEEYPFYDYATAQRWEGWIRFVGGEEQVVGIIEKQIDPDRMPSLPFSIFMGREDWRLSSEFLTSEYPDRRVHNMMADGSMMAVEVQKIETGMLWESGVELVGGLGATKSSAER